MGFEADVLVAGEARGRVLVLDEPLSFWGGVDPETGLIIDVHHPQHGESVAGCVLAMPHGRGSSSSTQVVAETLRVGTGPVGVIMFESDPIVMLGALVSGLLYETVCPVVVIGEAEFGQLRTGAEVSITEGGALVTFQ